MAGIGEKDRRQAPRSRVYWGAEASFSEYFEPFDCVVRDCSADGARIRLVSNVKLPETLKLWVASRQMNVCVKVVWRNGPVAGLKFEGFEPVKFAPDAPKPVIPKAALHR